RNYTWAQLMARVFNQPTNCIAYMNRQDAPARRSINQQDEKTSKTKKPARRYIKPARRKGWVMTRCTRFLMALVTIVSTSASLLAFGWQDTIARSPILTPASDHVPPDVRAARNNIFAPLVQNSPSLLERWSPSKPPR